MMTLVHAIELAVGCYLLGVVTAGIPRALVAWALAWIGGRPKT